MKETIDVTFDGNTFRPNSPVDLPAGAHGRVVMIESLEEKIAWFKARFPDIVGVMPDEDAEELMRLVDEGRLMSSRAQGGGHGST